MSGFEFETDRETLARLPQIRCILEALLDADEMPFFISDAATVFEVCMLESQQILYLLNTRLKVTLKASDLELPLWKLSDLVSQQSIVAEK